MSPPRVPRVATIACLAATVLAAIAIASVAWQVPRPSVGISTDSRVYLAMSRAIAEGTGLRDVDGNGSTGGDDGLSRRFPPAYPAVLTAVAELAGAESARAARLVNVACAGASTLLVALLVWRSRSSAARAAVAAALFAASLSTLRTHLYLWSEPLFTVFLLMTAVALDAYLRDAAARRRWLVAASVFVAGALLTRYAGAALVAAGALAIIARSPRPWRGGRTLDVAIFVVVPAAALAAWLTTAPPGVPLLAERTLSIAPIGWARVGSGLATLGTWIAWGGRLRGGATLVLGAAGLALTLVAAARALSRERATTTAATAFPLAYLAAYPQFLLLSITFVDPATPLDPRILAPLHAAAILVACATFDGRAARGAAVLIVAAQLASAALYVSDVRDDGLGYSSRSWRDRESVRFARALPADAPIFSTHAFALSVLTGRHVATVPYVADDGSARPDIDVRVMLDECRAAGGRGYLVLLPRPRWPTRQFMTLDELGRHVQLRPLAELSDGRVLEIVALAAGPPATQPTMR